MSYIYVSRKIHTRHVVAPCVLGLRQVVMPHSAHMLCLHSAAAPQPKRRACSIWRHDYYTIANENLYTPTPHRLIDRPRWRRGRVEWMEGPMWSAWSVWSVATIEPRSSLMDAARRWRPPFALSINLEPVEWRRFRSSFRSRSLSVVLVNADSHTPGLVMPYLITESVRTIGLKRKWNSQKHMSLATYGAIEMCFDWLIDWFTAVVGVVCCRTGTCFVERSNNAIIRRTSDLWSLETLL